MYNGKTFLAVIPARGESRRLPNKNILDLAGKPLISWTIEAALNSRYLDKIVVSSDSDKILSIAEKYKVEGIKRPYELATDTASTVVVLEHAIKNIKGNYDYVVLLQPTSPLRTSKHIDEAIELLDMKNADAVISVCETECPLEWCNTLPENLNMKDFIKKEILNKRSQDLPKYYRLNGAIFICSISQFLERKTFFLENSFAYIMDRRYSIDIDDLTDFQMAEFFITRSKYEDLYYSRSRR